MQDIEIIAKGLRAAVEAGCHQDAERCASEYCRAVEQEVRSLEPRDPRVERILREAMELLEWARRVALVEKASCAARLTALPERVPYAPPAVSRPSWAMVG